jgi:hypothetical protein
MARRRGHTEEQILAVLRQAETGTTVAEICREVGIRQAPGHQEGWGDEKVLEVELQTETQISRTDEQTFRLKPASEQTVEEQKTHILKLSELFVFRSD